MRDVRGFRTRRQHTFAKHASRTQAAARRSAQRTNVEKGCYAFFDSVDSVGIPSHRRNHARGTERVLNPRPPDFLALCLFLFSAGFSFCRERKKCLQIRRATTAPRALSLNDAPSFEQARHASDAKRAPPFGAHHTNYITTGPIFVRVGIPMNPFVLVFQIGLATNWR